MITILIGHRGVGKSTLLSRLAGYFPTAFCFDLDREVEKTNGSIAEIFARQGEEAFRSIEKKVFQDLYEQCLTTPVAFIAVGAGFQGEMPRDARVLWVQRAVDVSKYIFGDRPTLNDDKKNPGMPLELFEARTRHYRSIATEEYLMPEGEFETLREEELFFQNNLRFLGGALTVMPHDVRSPQFATWLKDRCYWNVEWLELRDDILSSDEIALAIKSIPVAKRLFSFRRREAVQSSWAHAALCARIDWPIEFGEPPAALVNRVIYSYHSEAANFEADLAKMNGTAGSVKWSPVIENLRDLERAHLWASTDPQRSLLPRSASGKWGWYRLVRKHKQPLNFFREGEGSALDQPSLVQWAQRDVRFQHFAAVLGSPVAHSWTPQFHAEFFKNKKMDAFAIDVSAEELENGGLEFLRGLGFRAFAVTSPLKDWATELVGGHEPCNTLAWSDADKVWYGTSTDKAGFLALVQQAEILFTRGKNAAIWGGGGVLQALREVLPLAHLYAAQTGRSRANSSAVENPSTVVWAGGESAQKILSCHPDWRPERVVDLNYRGDSAGLHYALVTGARYYSGREMFFAQAQEQQKFWRRYEWK